MMKCSSIFHENEYDVVVVDCDTLEQNEHKISLAKFEYQNLQSYSKTLQCNVRNNTIKIK